MAGLHYLSVGKHGVAVDVTSASWSLDSLSRNDDPIGIHCNASTTILAALTGDSSETTWVLPAGYTPLAFRSINTSSSTKNGYRIIFEK